MGGIGGGKLERGGKQGGGWEGWGGEGGQQWLDSWRCLGREAHWPPVSQPWNVPVPPQQSHLHRKLIILTIWQHFWESLS